MRARQNAESARLSRNGGREASPRTASQRGSRQHVSLSCESGAGGNLVERRRFGSRDSSGSEYSAGVRGVGVRAVGRPVQLSGTGRVSLAAILERALCELSLFTLAYSVCDEEEI